MSAVNAGIAAGSLVGGWAVAAHGVDAAVLVAAAVCALALPATWATRSLRAADAGPGKATAGAASAGAAAG